MKTNQILLTLGTCLLSGGLTYGQWVRSSNTVLLSNPTTDKVSAVPSHGLASGNFFFNFEATSTSATADVFRIKSGRDNTFTGALFRIDNSAGSKFFINGAGNIGVGTASPTARLDVDVAANAYVAHFRSGVSRLSLVPKNCSGCHNWITVNNDLGLYWSDGLASGGKNLSAGIVIAPHADAVSGLRIAADGKVQIGNTGSTPGSYRLYVDEGILTEKVKVAVVGTADWSDYVFAKDYKLMKLEEVEAFVKENKHLPNVPSAEEVVKEGIDVAKMDAKLLEKIEELTLYIIAQDKKITAIAQDNVMLKEQLKSLMNK